MARGSVGRAPSVPIAASVASMSVALAADLDLQPDVRRADRPFRAR
jgi:hypothetical protein